MSIVADMVFIGPDGLTHATITGAATWRGIDCDVYVSRLRSEWLIGVRIWHCVGAHQRGVFLRDGRKHVRERLAGAGVSGPLPFGASLADMAALVGSMLEQCLSITEWKDLGPWTPRDSAP